MNETLSVLQKFDVVIIGGGILGTTISYWLSILSNHKICVIEKENNVAVHASGRNTGVIHSPFYLDPQKREKTAKAAYISHDLWKSFVLKHGLPWENVGTIEIAINDSQHKTLEKYLKWGFKNGLQEDELQLLDSLQITKKEPNVKCHSGIYCKRDSSTDYGLLTCKLYQEAKRNGVEFLFGHEVVEIENQNLLIHLANGTQIQYAFIINCAGGNSLKIAKKFDLAKEYSSLNFRGEYWRIQQQYANLVKTNIYTVAKFANFPFLDPHWIKRVNGYTEIGPNAVPVADAETYSGYLGSPSKIISKFAEILYGGSKKLLLNPEFLSLISKEWKSSMSKNAMIHRVQEFIPKIKPEYFTIKGTAGIRTPIITKTGMFLADTLELQSENSFHIVNYNSPGATGAPAYSAYVVQKLHEKGFLKLDKNRQSEFWNFEKILEQMNL